jgi:hypothetical protein
MANQNGTLESLGISLGRLLAPIEERLTQGQVRLFFAELGMWFPPELEANTSFVDLLHKAASVASLLPGTLVTLTSAIQDEDEEAVFSNALELISLIKDTILSIADLATGLANIGGTLPGVDTGELNTFTSRLPTRILDYLVIRNMEAVSTLAETLEFIGAVERQDVSSPEFTFTRRELRLDELLKFLQSPRDHLKNVYRWGAPDFDGLLLLQKLEKLLVSNGFPAILISSGPTPVLDAFLGELSAKTDIDPTGLLLKVNEPIGIQRTTSFTQDDWTLDFTFDSHIDPSVQIIIQPNGNVLLHPPSGEFQGSAGFTWSGGRPEGPPYIILGEADGSRIEVKQFVAQGGIDLIWDTSQGRAEGAFRIGGEIRGGKIVIDFSHGDGFLNEILSSLNLESDFNLGLGFSSQEGIYFIGSAVLEIQLPIHINLGAVEISALTFSVGIQSLRFPISVGVNIKANLGPLRAVVEQIGVKAELSLPPDRNGNVGPINLAFGFLPPKGVGLSIDAGVVKGGGYLYFDFDKEEYAGALELVLSGFITLKAIGLITTKMPDGSKGFSLLVIISAEFGTGLQLGLGFTLLGVGGLLGLNRTMRLEPLTEGIRTGAIESIMFPRDVVANAPRIISDLRTFFPPADGRFLIGPMLKLGWGAPTLVSISLGLIIEIPPGNIAILGVLKVALPTPDAPILVLQVNFIGALEPEKKRLYFYAVLFESRVLFMTLEGGMGLLVAWGDNANFVVSVGGFHPRYNPPPLPFPEIPRMSINILNESWGRIRVQNYFAVTSNSVQFGAHAELYFGFSAISIEGHIGFDVLIQFSPFYFIAEISASVSLKVFGMGVFGIRLRFSLEGPTPWRAKGSGSISFFFFDVSADFDETWGESRDTSLPPISVMPILRAEFEKVQNWQALPPPSNNLLVSLRKLDPEADLVLHPVGTLRVSQRAVPLDLSITKVGSQRASDAKRFSVETTGVLSKAGDTLEQFAPAQFLDIDDASKLSRPGFEPQHGGVELWATGSQLGSSKAVKRIVRYEQVIIDSNFKRIFRRFTDFIGTLFGHFLAGSSVSLSPLSRRYRTQLQPFDQKIAVRPETYVVAFQANNQAFSNQASFVSEAMARDYLAQQIRLNPNQTDNLHVIPLHEVAA